MRLRSWLGGFSVIFRINVALVLAVMGGLGHVQIQFHAY